MAKHFRWVFGIAFAVFAAVSITTAGILALSRNQRGSSESIASLERQLDITIEYDDFPVDKEIEFIYTRIPRWHLKIIGTCERDELIRWTKERQIEVVEVRHIQETRPILVASFNHGRHAYNLQYFPSNKRLNVEIFAVD